MPRVSVGYARRPHGVRGGVIIRPLTDDADLRWRVGAELVSDSDPPVAYTVADVSPHADGLIVQFVGVNDRDAATALRGTSFTIDASERRDLEPGEYWPGDLVGCLVADEAGATLGTVTDVVLGGAQDRLVVATDRGPVEVPFVDALVPVVDVDARRIVVAPPRGLFPDDAT